jgi:hypothetical protein
MAEGNCRICRAHDANADRGRSVCDWCLGYENQTDGGGTGMSGQSENNEEFLYFCDIHGGHNGGKVGRTPTSKCMECIRDKTRGKRKPKDQPESIETELTEQSNPEPAFLVGQTEKIKTNGEKILSGSDFESYPGLFERLCEMAHDEVRNPGQQIIHYLRMALGPHVGISEESGHAHN